MPNNYIAVTTTGNRYGSTILGVADQLSQVLARLGQIKLDMDNMTDGVSFTALETTTGIQGGKGQTIYNLVAGAVADTNASSNLQNLINWLGALR